MSIYVLHIFLETITEYCNYCSLGYIQHSCKFKVICTILVKMCTIEPLNIYLFHQKNFLLKKTLKIEIKKKTQQN